MMELTINGKKYAIRRTLRCYFVHEQITGKVYDGKGLLQLVTLFYASLAACNETFEMKFDQFVDLLDEDPSLLERFTSFLTEDPANGKKKATESQPL